MKGTPKRKLRPIESKMYLCQYIALRRSLRKYDFYSQVHFLRNLLQKAKQSKQQLKPNRSLYRGNEEEVILNSFYFLPESVAYAQKKASVSREREKEREKREREKRREREREREKEEREEERESWFPLSCHRG